MGTQTFEHVNSAEGRLDVLRQTLLVTLRAYGVTLEDIAATRLATDNMHEKQPAR